MLTWLLVLELIGLIALPLTTRIFQRIVGHGIAFSKIVGLLVVSWVAWITAMFNLTPFNLVSVGIGVLVLFSLSWQAWHNVSQTAIKHAIRRYWKLWLLYELLFIGLFWLGVQLRLHGMYGSGVHHTEKPMELMMLSSVVNSPQYPPQDLWLSGYTLNYYYFGYVIVGALKVLSGVNLGVAFNLGIASVIALTGTAIAGLVYSMVMKRDQATETPISLKRAGLAHILSIFAIGLILFAGNQIGALQRITNSNPVNRLSDGQRLSALWQALNGKTPITFDPASMKGIRNDYNRASSVLPPMGEKLDAWPASRALYDDVGEGEIIVDGRPRLGMIQDEVITEFPFFSFYLADLHPHVLALPFVLLVLALAWAMLQRPSVPQFNQRGTWLEWFITSLSIGSLYMLNSWDAPTYGFIFALTLMWLFQQDQASWTWRDKWRYAKQLGLVVIGAMVLFAPFLVTFSSFAGQNSVPPPFDKIPIINIIGKIIAPARDHSSWSDLLIIFGLFLVPILAWIGRFHQRNTWLMTLAIFGVGVILGIPAIVFAPLAYILIQAAWRQANAEHFGLLLAGVGMLLIIVVDVIYLRDNFDRRFNTVFKVYYQVWMLLGIAASYALWRLLSERWWRKTTSFAWMPVFALLFVGALVYPISVLSPKTSPSFQSPRQLDGMVDSAYTTDGSRVVAEWMIKHTPANAVIASAVGNSYGLDGKQGGEVAALSGRPTLLNWPGSHESLWRTKQPEALAEVNARGVDITKMYTDTNPDVVRETLRKYNVSYIIFGPNERQAYPQNTGTSVFEQVGEKVFEQDGWMIYQVVK